MVDQIIVLAYLAITLIIGLSVGRNTKNVSDFAIGKRSFSNIALLATIFASLVDGNGTLGFAEAIFSEGPIYCLSFMGAIVSYFSLAYFIAPKMQPFFGLLSPGDILGKLYGPRAKIFMGFATVFESTLLSGVQILAAIHVAQYFFGLPANIAAFSTSIIILLYSLRGGIRAVTATDIFQFGIFLIAIPVMGFIILSKINYFSGLSQAINLLNTKSQPDYLKHMAIFLAYSIPAIFPLTIQRMLMAKDTKQIKSTFIMNGLLSLPFYLIISIIGIAGFMLLPNIEPNFVFPGLINNILPIGIKGLVIAGLLAIFMSSIDSSLNIGSVAITHDLITPFFKKYLTEKNILRTAKISSIFIALMATFAALYFKSVVQMMFFLMCVSNSAFFPGYLLGFLGFRPGRVGFWLGLIAAIISVLFFNFYVNLFDLYNWMISVSINFIILFVFHWQGQKNQKVSKIINLPEIQMTNN